MRKFLAALSLFSFLSAPSVLAADEELAPECKAGNFYIFVDKEANELTLRSFEDPPRILKSYRAITGTNMGDKRQEGDHKTPEGVYHILEVLPLSKLTKSIHGPAGLALDYPNVVDRNNKQTGSGIWIHGVESDARLERKFDTRGCVALGNDSIVQLRDLIKTKNTVVMIVDKALASNAWGWKDPSGPFGERVRAWAKAWSSKDLDAYVNFYHDDFVSRNMNKAAWKTYKGRLNKQYDKIEVTVENLEIYKHPKYTLTRFDQIYKSNRFQARGKKLLYWIGTDDAPQILAEESMNMKEGPVGSFDIQ